MVPLKVPEILGYGCAGVSVSNMAIGAAETQIQEKVNRLIVQIVRYKSGLSDEQVLEQYQARSSPEISRNSLITVRTDGLLTLNFGWLHDNSKTDEKVTLLREKLIEAGFIFKTEQQYPTIAPESWASKVEPFIRIIEEIRK